MDEILYSEVQGAERVTMAPHIHGVWVASVLVTIENGYSPSSAYSLTFPEARQLLAHLRHCPFTMIEQDWGLDFIRPRL
jgi:hypothetical protein